MVTFISLYRGQDIPSARVVAVSCDPDLIAYVSSALLQEREVRLNDDLDPALTALEEGRTNALRIITADGED